MSKAQYYDSKLYVMIYHISFMSFGKLSFTALSLSKQKNAQ